ncbi:MAG TPA: flavodoxin [Lachnospiraceae bacterium]|nr:flavodoxin [Lachnospiraceae bacterium]
MKKTLIVYFSLEGNTDYAARKIADSVGADLLALEPVMPYPKKGISKYLIGGMKASTHETPGLKPYKISPAGYDYIIFGTPVWASNYAPPLRTFIRDNKDALKGKKLAFFACSRGGNAAPCFKELAKDLKADLVSVQVSLIDPLAKKSKETDAKIEEFCERVKEG